MTTEGPIVRREELPVPTAGLSLADAKARLLAWGEERDAGARAGGSSVRSVLVAGAVAAAGAIVVSRLVLPRRTGAVARSAPGRVAAGMVRWVVFARVGRWLLPHAISALRGAAGSGRPRGHAGDRTAQCHSPVPQRGANGAVKALE